LLPFVLALVTTAVAALGGRVAVRVARLSAAHGGGAPLLVACWCACILAAALAGWLGATIGGGLAHETRAMAVAIVLLLAGAELLVLRARRAPDEPTRSFGAVLLVIAAAQVSAAAGLLVLALAAVTGGPLMAAAGGALGSGAVLTAAWSLAGEWESRLPLSLLRRGVAGVMLVAGLAIGLAAFGLL
jgi:hypothetical protein